MKHIIFTTAALLLFAAFGACSTDTAVNITEQSKNSVTEPANNGDEKAETSEVTEVPVEPTGIIEAENEPYIEEAVINDPILMPTPPFGYYLSDNVAENEDDSIELSMKSHEPNEIIDDENWFIDNGLSMNTYTIVDFLENICMDLPDEINDTWNDLMITSAFYDDSYIYCTYGSDFSEGYILNIYDSKTLNIVYTLDFSNYRYSPDYIEDDYDYIQQEIKWAEIKDNILYISHGHMTYAKSSKNMNAYITAIDLTDMNMLWRTDALVCNSYNFLITDDVIITGYGFTKEPDYLYQVSIHTGKILDKIPLKTAPAYIIKKDNVIFVRTYDTNYEFDIIDR